MQTEVHLIKAMVFPVVMYGGESWIRKKAEHWRIDAFKLCCWRRLLRVPWTTRRSNQSVLKAINWIFIGRTEAAAPILWPPDVKKRPWCCERLKAGGEGDDRGWDGWMASLTWWTWIWASSGSWWWTWKPGLLQSMGRKELDTTRTELKWSYDSSFFVPGSGNDILGIDSNTSLTWQWCWTEGWKISKISR